MQLLKIGDAAPDFDVPALIGGIKKRFRLSQCKGKKNVVLAFHPVNWTPVCARQMAEYNAELARFADYDAQVVAVSVDSIYSTAAWEKDIGPLEYTLASDYWPHGEVAQKFGVFRNQEPFPGVSERAVFVIDKAGKIVFSKVYAIDKLPEVAEIFEVLQTLEAKRAS
jgi:peroxiredoxin (alkyl hydroperoxide reductase subunit C)